MRVYGVCQTAKRGTYFMGRGGSDLQLNRRFLYHSQQNLSASSWRSTGDKLDCHLSWTSPRLRRVDYIGTRIPGARKLLLPAAAAIFLSVGCCAFLGNLRYSAFFESRSSSPTLSGGRTQSPHTCRSTNATKCVAHENTRSCDVPAPILTEPRNNDLNRPREQDAKH